MPKILTPQEIADFRQNLCQIALQQFSEKGIENTSMRSIANQAGCSSMTPYRYFKDKSELLAAVRAQGFREFIDSVEALIMESGDALDKMHALSELFFRFAVEKHDLYRLMFESKQSNEEEYPELHEQLQRLHGIWEHAADIGDQTQLLNVDSAMASQLFWAGMHGLVSLHMSDCLTLNYSFSELANEMVMTMFRGMARKKKP